MNKLDQVTAGKALQPPISILYGVGGIGKTSLAASAKDAIILRSEDRHGHIDCPKLPLCNSLEDVQECLMDLVRCEHPYRTLVVDSLDWTEKLIYSAICRGNKVSNINEISHGRGYSYSLTVWEDLIAMMDKLRREKRMQIICIAHAKVEKFENPMTESYDRYSLDLYRKSAGLFTQWADLVGFLNYEVLVSTEEGSFGKTTNKVSGGNRMLYLEERPAFQAKNSYDLPAKLPLEIGSRRLQWGDVTKLIIANLKKGETNGNHAESNDGDTANERGAQLASVSTVPASGENGGTPAGALEPADGARGAVEDGQGADHHERDGGGGSGVDGEEVSRVSEDVRGKKKGGRRAAQPACEEGQCTV